MWKIVDSNECREHRTFLFWELNEEENLDDDDDDDAELKVQNIQTVNVFWSQRNITIIPHVKKLFFDVHIHWIEKEKENYFIHT